MLFFVSYFNNLSLVINQKNLTKNLGLRILNAFSVIYQPDRMVQKASDVLAAYWRYQTCKKLL